MVTVRTIDSLDLPELAPYRSMRQQMDHLGRGVFVAEGEKVVRRLLESTLAVESVLLPPKWVDEYSAWLAARPGHVTLFVAPLETLQDLAGFSMYQGVLALAHVPPPMAAADIGCLPAPRLLVAMDGLSNAENVGAVIRSAVGLGAQAVLTGETSSHPYLRRSVRSSMGAIYKVPYLASTDLVQTLRQLADMGITTIAAHPHGHARLLADARLESDVCIVLGAEGTGLRPEVLAACAESVFIPMQHDVDSLNVGAAAAAFFYEAWRQRRRT